MNYLRYPRGLYIAFYAWAKYIQSLRLWRLKHHAWGPFVEHEVIRGIIARNMKSSDVLSRSWDPAMHVISAVKGILTRSNPNIRIFDDESWICQTIRVHRFVESNPRFVLEYSNIWPSGDAERRVPIKTCFRWSIIEIDFLCLNHIPIIEARIRVPNMILCWILMISLIWVS